MFTLTHRSACLSELNKRKLIYSICAGGIVQFTFQKCAGYRDTLGWTWSWCFDSFVPPVIFDFWSFKQIGVQYLQGVLFISGNQMDTVAVSHQKDTKVKNMVKLFFVA